MARYDYHCPSCGVVFEVEHPMGEKRDVYCPTCNTLAEHVFSTSGIVFKGSGYYNTDQRGKSGSTPATSCGNTTSATSGETSSTTTPTQCAQCKAAKAKS